MRNLMYLNNNWHATSPTNEKSYYDDFIQTNAIAVWKNKKNGLFPFYWNNEADEPPSWTHDHGMANAVLHAAGLSAINAAQVYWANDNID